MLLKAKDLMPGMQVDLAENPYVTQGKAVKELYFEVSSVEKREDGYVKIDFYEFESLTLPEDYDVYVDLTTYQAELEASIVTGEFFS